MLRSTFLLLAAALILPLGARSQSTADAARQAELAQATAVAEPGAQLRALEAFAAKYPKAPELEQVYDAILQDATQLSDDRRVLLYNEKLEALDPNDLGQRIKTLNLLLLETDAEHRQRAVAEAAEFSKMVEAKAAEPAPKEMGEVRWRLDLARLRSLAALFQGAAAQAVANYPEAERDLARSLQQSESEEAAEHLAQVYVAEGKVPQAIDAFALALALPGQTIAGREKLRTQAGELYKSQHGGSEVGFGDLILKRFDGVAARDAAEQNQLAPRAAVNAAAAAPGDFQLTALDGATHRLSEARGKVVVLDFWATWCGPCLVQHPLLDALRQEFANNHNVMFVAVNEDEDVSKVAPFVAEHKWAPTTWLDAGLGPFLGVDSLPTTLILDASGAVVYRAEGFTPDTFQAELRQAIQQALAPAR